MERTILYNARTVHADEQRIEENGIVMFNHENPVLPPDLIGYGGRPEGEGAPSLTAPLAEDALMDLEGAYLLPGYIDLDMRIEESVCVGAEGKEAIRDAEGKEASRDAEGKAMSMDAGSKAASMDAGEAALRAYKHAGNALNTGVMAFACADSETVRAVIAATADYTLWAPEIFPVGSLCEKEGFFILRGIPAPGSEEEAQWIRYAKAQKQAGKKPVIATGRKPEEKLCGLIPVIYAAKLLSENGFTALEAIASITSNPAEYLGVSDRIGGLHTGMEGNTVAIKGDPLSDLSALQDICMLARGGRLTWSHMKALDRIRFGLVPPGCEEV